MTTIYHNPRCSKSRQALALLEDNGIQPEVVLYMDGMLNTTELKNLASLLGFGPREMLRSKEAEYKEHKLDDPATSEDELFAAMAQHPRLIERPVVVHEGKAVIARPPEKLLEIL